MKGGFLNLNTPDRSHGYSYQITPRGEAGLGPGFQSIQNVVIPPRECRIRGIIVKNTPFYKKPPPCFSRKFFGRRPKNFRDTNFAETSKNQGFIDFQPPAGGKFLGSGIFIRNPPLFLPDLKQGGVFLTIIPLISVFILLLSETGLKF